jgi:hypothetical protein
MAKNLVARYRTDEVLTSVRQETRHEFSIVSTGSRRGAD